MANVVVIETIEESAKGLVIGISAGFYIERGLGLSFTGQLVIIFIIFFALIVLIGFLKRVKYQAMEEQ